MIISRIAHNLLDRLGLLTKFGLGEFGLEQMFHNSNSDAPRYANDETNEQTHYSPEEATLGAFGGCIALVNLYDKYPALETNQALLDLLKDREDNNQPSPKISTIITLGHKQGIIPDSDFAKLEKKKADLEQGHSSQKAK